MSDGIQFFDIIILAIVAAFIFAKLRNVLGRRTGNEPQHGKPLSRESLSDAAGGNDNVVPIPGQERRPQEAPDLSGIASEGSDVANALTKISLADRQFEPRSFLEGAKVAYETIVHAFAKGDKDTLRPLLGDDVFKNFADAIDARERNDQTQETTLVGIRKAEIVDGSLRGRIAEITVKFISDLISCTRNAEGEVIDGHPTAQREVTDIWTFARDTRSADPNWTLVATGAA